MPELLRRAWRAASLLILVTLALLLTQGPGFRALAQGTTGSAQLSTPDASKFPAVSALLWVYDANGQFVSGLKSADVSAIEDGQALPLDSLAEQQPGAQLVVAINPGPALAVRDGLGVARYDKIRQFLGAWVGKLPAGNSDDLSLVSGLGTLAAHTTPAEWLKTLNSFNPDLRGSQPSLAALSAAVDVASEAPPRPGMGRAVLFITPHLDLGTLKGLESLGQRAAQEGIRISVWLVDSEAYAKTSGAQTLQGLALQSGGTYATFTGAEALPDPETLLDGLRRVYLLSYTSHINKPGEHILAASATLDGGPVTSPNQTLSVDIQPPSAVLVSPPSQITRQTDPADVYNLQTYSPVEQKLELLIEFPDGHPRPLRRTTLLVDGQPVAENTAEPFDKFTWDLSGYMDSAQHDLAVEVEDSLGLSRRSFPVPITLTVVRPPGGLQGLFAKNQSLIITLAIITAGGVLLFILFTGLRTRRAVRAGRRPRGTAEDPVTQPVIIRADDRRATSSSLARMRRRPSASPAYLAPLTPDGLPAPGSPIPLIGREMTFGLDPTQASHVLDDPSVSPLHARIRQDDRGVFTLFDHGSVAGTWLNYEPVGREGRRLHHGDIIQIGRITHRFVLSKAPSMPLPRVVPRQTGGQ